MNITKVVARNPQTKRQQIKKIYIGDKFKKYGEHTSKRYQSLHDVEIYEMYNEEWIISYELKMPRTKEEIYKYCEEMNYGVRWAEYRIKDLGL